MCENVSYLQLNNFLEKPINVVHTNFKQKKVGYGLKISVASRESLRPTLIIGLLRVLLKLPMCTIVHLEKEGVRDSDVAGSYWLILPVMVFLAWSTGNPPSKGPTMGFLFLVTFPNTNE